MTVNDKPVLSKERNIESMKYWHLKHYSSGNMHSIFRINIKIPEYISRQFRYGAGYVFNRDIICPEKFFDLPAFRWIKCLSTFNKQNFCNRQGRSHYQYMSILCLF